IAAEGFRARAKIELLEQEVEALLSSPAAARRLYEGRIDDVAREIDAARAHRQDVESRIGGAGVSEMERSRDALAAASSREREQTLVADLKLLKEKLARVSGC